MKAAPFGYARARDATHAVELLAAAEGYAKVVAGGQSLGPMLNLRLVEPDLLVDVRACPDLRRCRDDGESILFGAAVTHSEIEDGAVPDPCHGWLAAAARRIAYRAVRNRGTIGGSIAHADPAADWLVVLLLIGAEAVVLGPEGMRTTALAEFVAGPFLTTLGEDEVLCAIRAARRSNRARYGYRKTAIRVGEFASAFCVAIDDPERGESRAVLGAIERTPIVVDDLSAVSDTAGAEAFVDAHVPGLDAATVRLHAVTLRRAVRDLDGARRPT
ncbi:MAG: FAD binding domain-containing protein [Chromatiales bacterium]|nr:FAD binding domain-containing protein [Chromatiales bacterium]